MEKSKYETHVLPNLEKVTKWAEDGATVKAIAKRLKIAYSTLRRYIDEGKKGNEKYEALSAAFVQACEVADEDVENALYKSCIGYNAKVAKHYKVKRIEYDEETGKKISEKEELVTVYDEVHVPANTSAQQFWLTNRKPNRWSYKPAMSTDEDGEGGVVVIPSVMQIPPPPTERNEECG